MWLTNGTTAKHDQLIKLSSPQTKANLYNNNTGLKMLLLLEQSPMGISQNPFFVATYINRKSTPAKLRVCRSRGLAWGF